MAEIVINWYRTHILTQHTPYIFHPAAIIFQNMINTQAKHCLSSDQDVQHMAKQQTEWLSWILVRMKTYQSCHYVDHPWTLKFLLNKLIMTLKITDECIRGNHKLWCLSCWGSMTEINKTNHTLLYDLLLFSPGWLWLLLTGGKIQAKVSQLWLNVWNNEWCVSRQGLKW